MRPKTDSDEENSQPPGGGEVQVDEQEMRFDVRQEKDKMRLEELTGGGGEKHDSQVENENGDVAGLRKEEDKKVSSEQAVLSHIQ